MNPLDQATNGAAIGAITSHWWLPSLHDISSTCAEWAPAAGIGWIAFQVSMKLYDRWRGRNE